MRFEGDDRVDSTVRARVGGDVLEEMNLGCISVGVFCLFDDGYRGVVTVGD